MQRRYGRLQVLETFSRGRNRWARCACDCGRTKEVRLSSLRDGYTRSCGCIASERIAKQNTTHGDCTGGPSAEWVTWHSMRQRCENPKHKSFDSYGGRGIRVCDRWQDFSSFLEDMGRRPDALSLERLDNDVGYEPSNCIWATRSQQASNRRPRGRDAFGRFA